MAFFRDYYAWLLNKGWVKIIVLWLFVAYLGVSAWAVSRLEEGLERKRLSRYDSYSVTFYNMEDEYFREYPYRVNVRILIAFPLEYFMITFLFQQPIATDF